MMIVLIIQILQINNISGESPILIDVLVDIIIGIKIKGILIVVAEGGLSVGVSPGFFSSIFCVLFDFLFAPDIVVILIWVFVFYVVDFD